MTADLTSYRGKRALVCGIPRDGAKTQQVWLDATDKALRELGAVEARSVSLLSSRHVVRVVKDVGADFVLLAWTSPLVGQFARNGAKAAGVPVLRVRRDGSIEVEASDA